MDEEENEQEKTTTPLHEAVLRNDYSTVLKICTNQQRLIDVRDHEGRTALHLASEIGNVDILQCLCINGANLLIEDIHGDLPVDLSQTKEVEMYLTACTDVRNHKISINLDDWTQGLGQQLLEVNNQLSELEYNCRLLERLTPISVISIFPDISNQLKEVEKLLFQQINSLCIAQIVYKVHQQVNQGSLEKYISFRHSQYQSVERMRSLTNKLKHYSHDIKQSAFKQLEQILELKTIELEDATQNIQILTGKVEQLQEQIVQITKLEEEITQKDRMIMELEEKTKLLKDNLQLENKNSANLNSIQASLKENKTLNSIPSFSDKKSLNYNDNEGSIQIPAYELIQEIRKEKGYDIDIPEDGPLKKCFEALYFTLGNALEKLSVDIYSSDSRFILELIQNADDNDYNPDVEFPQFKLEVNTNSKNGYVWVYNNELGFFPRHVRSICDVGGSTKGDASKYVGRKGVGFKSVFKVSDRPHIFSRDFSFGFDAQKPLGQIVPEWINEKEVIRENPDLNILFEDFHSKSSDTGTAMYLPLRSGHDLASEEILTDLSGIDYTLLFLRKLKKLDLTIINEEPSQLENKSTSKDTTKVERRIITLHNTQPDDTFRQLSLVKFVNNNQVGPQIFMDFKVHTSLLVIPEHIRNSDGSSFGGQTKLTLAFPILDDEPPIQYVYAFLPICSSGFRFIIQGDFELVTSRQEVHRTKAMNLWLRENIPLLFIQALRADEDIKKRLHLFLPNPIEISQNFWKVVADKIWLLLNEEECILTESGVLRSPKNVLIKPEGFEDLISNQELFNALKKEWLSPHVDSKIMMERMNIKEFSLIDMIEFLNALKDDEIQAKSHKWIARLYEFFEKFVNDKLDQYIPQLLGFKIFRITLTENFESISLQTRNGIIFSSFPVGATLETIIGLDINFLQPETVNGKSNLFLERMGIKHATTEDLIDLFLLQHSNSTNSQLREIKPSDKVGTSNLSWRELTWNRLKFLKDYCMESLLISKAKFEEFRSLLLIPSSEDSFFLGSQLYFLHCKQLFDDHTNQVHYLDDSIFQQLETEDEKISWIQFFELLGVSKSPRLIAVVKDGLVLRELSTEFFEILVKAKQNMELAQKILEIVDQYWTTLFYFECPSIIEHFKECKVSSTFGDERGFTELFSREIFEERINKFLPYPAYTIQNRDLGTKLGMISTFNLSSVIKCLHILSEHKIGTEKIWDYLYEYLLINDVESKTEEQIDLPFFHIPGEIPNDILKDSQLTEEMMPSLVKKSKLRWSGNEDFSNSASLLVLQNYFSDKYKKLFVNVFRIQEALSVEDMILSISSLVGQIGNSQDSSTRSYLLDLIIQNYRSLDEILEENTSLTLYPLDNLPLLVENGKGNFAFETFNPSLNTQGWALPYVDDEHLYTWFERDGFSVISPLLSDFKSLFKHLQAPKFSKLVRSTYYPPSKAVNKGLFENRQKTAWYRKVLTLASGFPLSEAMSSPEVDHSLRQFLWKGKHKEELENQFNFIDKINQFTIVYDVGELYVSYTLDFRGKRVQHSVPEPFFVLGARRNACPKLFLKEKSNFNQLNLEALAFLSKRPVSFFKSLLENDSILEMLAIIPPITRSFDVEAREWNNLMREGFKSFQRGYRRSDIGVSNNPEAPRILPKFIQSPADLRLRHDRSEEGSISRNSGQPNFFRNYPSDEIDLDRNLMRSSDMSPDQRYKYLELDDEQTYEDFSNFVEFEPLQRMKERTRNLVQAASMKEIDENEGMYGRNLDENGATLDSLRRRYQDRIGSLAELFIYHYLNRNSSGNSFDENNWVSSGRMNFFPRSNPSTCDDTLGYDFVFHDVNGNFGRGKDAIFYIEVKGHLWAPRYSLFLSSNEWETAIQKANISQASKRNENYVVAVVSLTLPPTILYWLEDLPEALEKGEISIKPSEYLLRINKRMDS